MNFLIIVDDYLPTSTKVAAKMMHELAIELISRGNNVTVLTPQNNQKKKMELTVIDSVTVINFKSGKIKNTNKIKRGINESMLSYFAWKSAGKYLTENPQDIILYYSPSIFWSQIVKRLKKKWTAPSYLILRDIFPQWTIDNGLMKNNSTIHKYFKFFEKKTYEAADCIGVMSPKNLDYFNKHVKSSKKVEVLYNWSKISDYDKKLSSHRKNLKLENKVVLFYGGNIGVAQNIENLLKLAIKLRDNDRAHFLFVGNGDEVFLVKEFIERYNLTNTTYLPSVNQEIYEEMLCEFDIGLFSLHPNHSTHNFPGKLLSYMFFEKPILGSVNKDNDLMYMINSENAGFVFENGNDENLTKAALDLIDSVKLRLEMGQNGKALLENRFSVKNAANQIIDFLDEHYVH